MTVADKIASLYGANADLSAPAGVVHILAGVWQGDDLQVIKIGPRSPKSETDFFLLNLSRARSDAILATGGLLRAEPDLSYDLQGRWGADLESWRRDHGRVDPPYVLVLTSGRNLDLDHRVFHGWARPVILTGEDAATRLRAGVGERSIAVVGVPDPGPAAALRWAREQGARTLTIEAGPTTARQIYEGADRVDEIMLSEFLGELPDDLLGGRAVRGSQLRHEFEPLRPPVMVEERSGPWRFSRWRRL